MTARRRLDRDDAFDRAMLDDAMARSTADWHALMDEIRGRLALRPLAVEERHDD